MPSNNTINKNFDEQEFKILKEINEGKNREDIYKKWMLFLEGVVL